MKINEVIRMYRKEQNLTQEQIANYLGVTAPAVNKWEKGISYPDITLLAPLARILKINVDTLLSFNEDLTDKEVDQLVRELSEIMQKEGYDAGYAKASERIKEYPNCDKLTLFIAQILNAYLSIKEVENRERYETRIVEWYEIVVTSKDELLSSMATASLCQIYMGKKEYDKAQQLLDKVPPIGYDKRMIQAMLLANQDKNEEAYEIYEMMLHESANEIYGTLQVVINLLCKEKKFEDADMYAGIAKQIAELFDLGTYMAWTPQMLLAIEKKDKELSIKMIEHMVDGLASIEQLKKSPLYSRIKINKLTNLNEVKSMLKKSFENDQKLDFIREEPRFKRILKKLD